MIANHLKVKDAAEEITVDVDVAHRNNPVVVERVIAMDLLTVVSMMVIMDAKETLSAAVTIARSLAFTSIQKMIVVIIQRMFQM